MYSRLVGIVRHFHHKRLYQAMAVSDMLFKGKGQTDNNTTNTYNTLLDLSFVDITFSTP